ncbi:MAG: TonB-dependent receptor plug domain-containing protein [Flavobacteriales bacterium]
MKKYQLLLTACLVSAAHGGMTQDTLRMLPEVTISEKRLIASAATRNVQILNRDDLERMPVQSVQEALAYIAGVDLRQRGPWGGQADITMLGSTFEQVLILVNGIPMRDPQTGHHNVNLPIDLAMVERIEVLKGTAGRIYGANALAGAVNIVTRKPGEQQLFIQAYGGSDMDEGNDRGRPYALGGGRVSIGRSSEDGASGHQIDYSFFRTDGFRYNSANTQHRLNYLGQYKVAGGQLDVIGSASDNQFGAHGYYAYPFDTDAWERVRTAFGGMRYTLVAGEWKLRPLVYYRYNHDDYIFIRNRPEVYRNNHFTTATGAEFHASRTNRWGTFGIGYESRAEIIRSNNLGHHERFFHALYAEQQINTSGGLQLTAGANVQYASGYGVRIYPGVECSQTISRSVGLFAHIGGGSRLPTYTDLYYSDRANRGNPDLRPETAWTGEAGVRYHRGNLTAQLSGFSRLTDSFIDFVRENDTLQWQPRNFSQVQIYGGEAMLQYSRRSEAQFALLNASVRYTYLAGEVSRGVLLNKYALDHLAHQLIVQAECKTGKRLSHSMICRYLERFNGASYAVFDYRLRYSGGPFAAFVDAANLLGRQYVESGFVPMPGRWFRIGVEWRI